ARRAIGLCDGSGGVRDHEGDRRTLEELTGAQTVGQGGIVHACELVVLHAQLLFGDGKLLERGGQLLYRLRGLVGHSARTCLRAPQLGGPLPRFGEARLPEGEWERQSRVARDSLATFRLLRSVRHGMGGTGKGNCRGLLNPLRREGGGRRSPNA